MFHNNGLIRLWSQAGIFFSILSTLPDHADFDLSKKKNFYFSI